MCTIEPGSLPYPPGMTEAEYNAVFKQANDTPVITTTRTQHLANYDREVEDVDRKATERHRKGLIQKGLDQWVQDNPERHRLGILAAKGLPTTQAAKSPIGSATTEAGASAALGGEGGGMPGGAENLLEQRRKKTLLGG